MVTRRPDRVRDAIEQGRTSLGIELGSTRIKAVLIGPEHAPIAGGGHDWENRLVDGHWTYPLDAVWDGLRDCFADLVADVERQYGIRPRTFGAIGVSAMMHGYLAFDGDELLVPFRTWRDTTTEVAARELTDLFGYNIPLRWSVAHHYQAVLDAEPHVARTTYLTTLAGYVHWRLTGRKVLGIGDASGMFPVDTVTGRYDAGMLAKLDEFVAARVPGDTGSRLADLLPEILPAGADAGALTPEGAALLDPSGALRPGVPLCPPEGDAGTGMVATNAVEPRTGNISAGTSIFAMVVLEGALRGHHPELDLVTTPAGDLVAMVHCNNGASELGAWAEVFRELSAAVGGPSDADTVFEALFRAALDGEPDGGGLLAYNQLSGEPIAGLAEGRPMIVRTPDSRLTLANLARTQIYGVFATLSLGMRVLADEGVEIDAMFGHGGLFRTAGVAQRMLAAAIGAPVGVGQAAGEGGAWGMAVLAAYLRSGEGRSLGDYLAAEVFADAAVDVVTPEAEDTAGFATYLERYTAGLAAERAAVEAVKPLTTTQENAG